MSPRVGTIVALVAAALLAISIATPKWWAGHPNLDGVSFNRKTANIGLITANQCNFADDEETQCQHLAVGGPVAFLKFVQLGLTGALALLLLGLAIARDRRKGVAKLVMIAVALAAVMAVVMLVIGPDLKTGRTESMPLGYGFILFFVASALSIAGSAISMMPARVPRPKLPKPVPMPPPVGPSGPHPQPAFDVEALLADDALRPYPPSPGGPLPGPAGPLSAQSGAQPLFQSAPQLRPLYEANGVEPPVPAVQFPTRGPTPMPQQAVSTMLGLDLPPPPPAAVKLPPPSSRTKPLSVAPPIPQIPPRLKPPTRPPPRAPQPTKMGAAVPAPPDRSPDRPPDRPSELPTSAFARADAEGGTETEAPAFGGEETTSNDAGDDIATSARDAVEHTDPEPEPISVPPPAPPVTGAKARQSAKVPITTAQADLPPPRAETGGGGPSPACPQCEAPMGWVEEHLRFYCKACKMYF